MSERRGVEIDYCPECRGVWLDRGELDKIVDGPRASRAWQPPVHPESAGTEVRRVRWVRRHQSGPRATNKKKRKESWLSELFD